MQIDGTIVTVQKSATTLFTHFTQLPNFERLMPENIEKFEVDGDTFIFGLKGMPEIRLVLKETIPYSKIILAAASSKLPFTLTALINEVSENQCTVQFQFEGDFNPMMAMMVKKPLTKFIDTLSSNIEKF